MEKLLKRRMLPPDLAVVVVLLVEFMWWNFQVKKKKQDGHLWYLDQEAKHWATRWKCRVWKVSPSSPTVNKVISQTHLGRTAEKRGCTLWEDVKNPSDDVKHDAG